MPDSGEFDCISKIIQGQLRATKKTEAEALRANQSLIEEQAVNLEESLRRKMAELHVIEKEAKEKNTLFKNNQTSIIQKLLADDAKLNGIIARDKKANASRQATNTLRQSKFRVPKGTGILIPKDYSRLQIGRPGDTQVLDGIDFEEIISSKDVVYDFEDVCMNPTTGWCTLSSLRNSLYFRDENYFGFNLPSNDKKIPFILVQRRAVHISTDETGLDIMDILNRDY